LRISFTNVSFLVEKGKDTDNLCHILAQPHFIFASANQKRRHFMWLAVIIFVSLSVEVLSYLTGGEIKWH